MPWESSEVAAGDEATAVQYNNLRTDVMVAAPPGIIVMWSGTLANIPTGWLLCDGDNGTPDLRERFIMGARAGENPGATGGANDRTLAAANIPSHSHGAGTLGADSDGAHTHDLRAEGPGFDGLVLADDTFSHLPNVEGTRSDQVLSAGAHTHSISGSTAATGSGTAFDNRPAYYELAFIMKE